VLIVSFAFAFTTWQRRIARTRSRQAECQYRSGILGGAAAGLACGPGRRSVLGSAHLLADAVALGAESYSTGCGSDAADIAPVCAARASFRHHLASGSTLSAIGSSSSVELGRYSGSAGGTCARSASVATCTIAANSPSSVVRAADLYLLGSKAGEERMYVDGSSFRTVGLRPCRAPRSHQPCIQKRGDIRSRAPSAWHGRGCQR